jgi:hypothetical protein
MVTVWRKQALGWIGIGLLLGCAITWSAGAGVGGLAQARAQAGGGPAETSGTIVIASPQSDSSQLLYVVDTKTQSFAVYRVDSRDPKGAVKLEAARHYRWDLKLAEFNNQAPEVATIESMVGAPRK